MSIVPEGSQVFWMVGGGLVALQVIVAFALYRRSAATLSTPRTNNAACLLEPVSIIMPVWGKDEFTAENFAAWANQVGSGRNEIVFSFQEEADPALAIAEGLQTRSKKILVVHPVKEGFNGKMSNLFFGVRRAGKDVLVWCDSDTQAGPHFCEQVLGLLQRQADVVFGVPVQCKARNLWARAFAQLYNVEILGFLAPAVERSGATGIGAVVGMRRQTLERLGGIEAFKDAVADGRAIGKRAKSLGLRVALGPLVPAPVGKMPCRLMMDKLTRAVLVEKGKGALADTVLYRTMYAYIGLVLAGVAFTSMPLLVAGGLSAVLRLAFSSAIWAKATGERRLLVDVFLFDALIVGVYVRSFFSKTVRWGGIGYAVSRNGGMKADGG